MLANSSKTEDIDLLFLVMSEQLKKISDEVREDNKIRFCQQFKERRERGREDGETGESTGLKLRTGNTCVTDNNFKFLRNQRETEVT